MFWPKQPLYVEELTTPTIVSSGTPSDCIFLHDIRLHTYVGHRVVALTFTSFFFSNDCSRVSVRMEITKENLDGPGWISYCWISFYTYVGHRVTLSFMFSKSLLPGEVHTELFRFRFRPTRKEPQEKRSMPLLWYHVHCCSYPPPLIVRRARKRLLVGCSSPFMRLAEYLTALRAWCDVCLVGKNPMCPVPAS